jgi:hypothetical protein
MKMKCLLPLAMTFFAFTVPTWAGPSAPTGILAENPTDLVSADSYVTGSPPQPDAGTNDIRPTISDTLPMVSLDLSTLDVGVDFLVQQISTESNTYDDALGLLFTFKSP